MKKALISLLLLVVPGFASAMDGCCGDWWCNTKTSLALRAAYFRPQSSKLRDHYAKNWVEWQLEANMRFCCDWAGWLNVGYSHKSGHHKHQCGCPDEIVGCIARGSEFQKNKLRTRIIPITVGFKRYFCSCWECVTPYLGFGVGTAYAHLKNKENFGSESCSDHHKKSKWGWALALKSGFEWDITQCIYSDFFLDYDWIHVNHMGHGHDSQLGGLKLGAGLGWRF